MDGGSSIHLLKELKGLKMRLNQADNFLWEILVSASGTQGVAAKFLVLAQNKVQAEFKLKEKDFFLNWAKNHKEHRILITKRHRSLGTIPKEGIAA